MQIFCCPHPENLQFEFVGMLFPKELKAGEVSSLFKSLDAFIKKNYRPITVLSSVSKIYERVLESQIKSHALSFLSPLLCGFREGYGTQHALLRLIETCKKTLDKGGVAGALLMDLSKAFDCKIKGLRFQYKCNAVDP